ncbi:MAG: MOSC domain-containing protein [Kiritimatiellae bacterium]|nr:MOSC domain-containing protein [Kiritimatiellia bacterium]
MQIASVNISEQKGITKHPVDEIVIDKNGIVGDAHAGPWHRQISLLSEEIIKNFESETGRPTKPGEFAENITTRGINLRKVAILDKLIIGNTELEITQIGKTCHGDTCAIFTEVGTCVMPKEGLFCRVLKPGTVKTGDTIQHIARPMQIRVITVSDRASRGDYPDKSGPRIVETLNTFFENKRWHLNIQTAIVSDDANLIRAEIEDAYNIGADAVFTTGGTGVGSRDITPDVALKLIDREIPGIMEHIRTKFGANKPNALLSRSVAGTMGQTLIYTLPGSVKAVEEYMSEILRTFEHTVFMINNLDNH